MISFRYKTEATGKKDGLIKRPVADVYLQSVSGSWIEFHPYIDSGADVTLIPLSFGKLLGLTRQGKRVERIGGISSAIPIIYYTNKMRAGPYELLVKIAWSLIENVPPLLGRADIFDQFHVTFKQNQELILFDKRT